VCAGDWSGEACSLAPGASAAAQKWSTSFVMLVTALSVALLRMLCCQCCVPVPRRAAAAGGGPAARAAQVN
jgi:hypothetical protein